MIKAAVTALILFLTAFVFGACRVAGDADRRWEQNLRGGEENEEHTIGP